MLTKRKALEKTIEMWSWLAEHPDKDKEDFFEFKNISNIPYSECYCCEFDGIWGNCRNCPIINWNYDADNNMVVVDRCTNSGSAYGIWRSAIVSTKTKQQAARRIAELAELELNKLKKANVDLVEIKEGFYYSLSFVKENMLPHLSKTRDFDNLLENLSFEQLQKIEHILGAYSNKIDMEVSRYEDGIPMFDGDFELIIKDKSYEQNGFEILVLKWIEDYEDTGYLVDCLKENKNELF